MGKIPMTPKEFAQFKKIQHKSKIKQDAKEFAIPGLGETIFILEDKIRKIENLVKTISAQSDKAYANSLENARVINAIQIAYEEKHGTDLIPKEGGEINERFGIKK